MALHQNYIALVISVLCLLCAATINISSTIAYNFNFEADSEFAKDLSSLAVESTLKSKCPGTIFIITSECEDHFNHVGEEVSFWSNPIVIINYDKPSFLDSLTNSQRQLEKWSFFLQSKISPSSNFIFICDLVKPRPPTWNNSESEASSIRMDFITHFPKPLIRSVDEVLYFDGSSLYNTHTHDSRVFQTQLEILKYAEILMFINKNKSQTANTNTTSAVLSAYSTCKYCRPSTTPISNELLGTWQRNKTTIAKYFTIFQFKSEYQFHNYTFQVGYSNYRPHFSCFPKSRSKPHDTCSGIEWKMLSKMSQQLQFTIGLNNFTMKGGHGIIFSDENITGMIGAIANEKIDLGLGGVSVTSLWNRHVDFTKIFATEAIVFVVEKRRDIYILGIWLAFQPAVWPIIICTILCLSVLFKYTSNHRITLSYGLQYAISPLLGQPLTHPLVSTSPRHLMKIFLAIWWFMSLIIGILYNTSLITSLITPVTPKEAETLNELIESSYKFRLGSKQSVAYGMYGILQQFETTFHNDDDDDEEKSYEKMVDTSNGISISFKLIAQRLVSNAQEQNEGDTSNVVYVLEESDVEALDWEKIYGFARKRVIRERLILTPYAWALRQGSPFKRKFDNIIDQLGSVGLLNYWHDQSTLIKEHAHTPSSKFKLQGKLGQIKMNLSVLHGAFIFFLIGCTVSGVVFGMELLTKRYSFRFYTLTEIKEFYKKLVASVKHVHRINIGREIVQAGKNTIQIVAPLNAGTGTVKEDMIMKKRNRKTKALQIKPEENFLK